ncbi:MAG: class I SAM-dependent rRNA methyltransferase [Elusimicrobia bacterium]|nr:class I SAM-dependent rRNA methyltransferase [Elusimicrobiota bacterium]
MTRRRRSPTAGTIPRATDAVVRPLPSPSTGSGLPFVRLKNQEDRRVRRGHLWIFSNEIERAADGIEPGGLVEFLTSRDERLGIGFYNAKSLIAGRLLDRRDTPIDAAFFIGRFQHALALRQRFYADNAFRWVHGESDDLPGLVIDRYGDVCVIESFAAGIDRLLPFIVEAVKSFGPWQAIVLRNDATARRLEHLSEDVRVLEGTMESSHWFSTDGILMAADPLQGQKTGFFFDQRVNRAAVAALSPGKNVLDVFCHTGGFGLWCAKAGATHVLGIDASAPALALAQQISEKNGWAKRCVWQKADAFEHLTHSKETYDIVVLDPPRFAATKKNLPEAIKAYVRLNALGLKRVTGGGFLATASCSQHVSRDDFRQIIARAGHESGRKVKIVFQGSPGPDHPVRPSMPETDYLKFALLHVA